MTNADYHTIVRTDARNNILESDEDNNDGFSFDLTNVDIEEIFIDVAREDTLYPNQIQYYKLNIGADEAGSNVLLSLIHISGMPQVSNLTQINTLYSQLSYGTLYNWQVVAKNVCNNMMPGPVQQFFVRHLPDLIVESMIIPSTAFSEQTISVEWVIDNQGLGVTNPGTWFDNIYLSNDATYNSFDPLLASVPNLRCV